MRRRSIPIAILLLWAATPCMAQDVGREGDGRSGVRSPFGIVHWSAIESGGHAAGLGRPPIIARLGLKPVRATWSAPSNAPWATRRSIDSLASRAAFTRPRAADFARTVRRGRILEHAAVAESADTTPAESSPPDLSPARIRAGDARRADAPLADSAADRASSPDSAADERDPLEQLTAGYADLGLAVQGRAEMGGAWTRFRPCDPSALAGCDPGAFPRLRPEVDFGVRVGGTIADRIHVDVDYDQRREFDAANNITLEYRGLPGEALERVEVGDVSIRLPRSRYLTDGIPAGNFGLKATSALGPLNVEAVWAQQRGEVSSREWRPTSGGGEGLVQELELTVDDAEYAADQFFFIVHPDSIAGAPHLDALRLSATDAPATLRPSDGTLQVYRTDRVDPQHLAVGYVLAEAVTAAGDQRHGGQFRRLVAGDDYRLDKSGLWIALRAPLQPDEALAIAYRTEAGDTVGTLDADRVGRETSDRPTLRLLRGPAARHSPTASTWPFEMRQVYRIDGTTGVDRSSVELEISLGVLSAGMTDREVAGRRIALIQLFGMDEERPLDRLDESRILQPVGVGDTDSGGLTGTFVVFPTLEPFAIPPPGRRAGLSADEARAALGSDANATIYDADDPVVREGAGRFRLHFRYRVRMDGLISSFDLGALGVREGSERIYVGDRLLEAGEDYTIDYELGTVRLARPQELFAADPDAELRATYEQKPIFQLAPTSVFGINAASDLGGRGELNLVGLYQREQSLMSRPQLGLEPGAVLLGGASGRIELGAGWLDRVLAAAGIRTGASSFARLDGELALSMPTPNTRGQTYLDDFEAADETAVGLDARYWRLGSRPRETTGAGAVLPAVPDAANAAGIVWQHRFRSGDRTAGPLLPGEIDRQIRVGGHAVPEPVLHVSVDAPDPAGDVAWRSLTTVLSTTGRDMSRAEYLEFYASADGTESMALVLDLGTVGEDAYYIDDDGRVQGRTGDGRAWGLGTLDEEAALRRQEVWGPDRDAAGLWDQDCRAEPGRVYPLGDARANCTAGNNVPDTEDLNGNGMLDAGGEDGPYFRYVVPLAELSEYRVRGPEATGTGFALYRIPLRGTGARPVNGAVDATWRHIQHLRVTFAGRAETGALVRLARLRIIGSRWSKRGRAGILSGPAGPEPATGASGTLRVGPVSRLTDGAAYASPPGVRAELQDPSTSFAIGGQEYGERSLRFAYAGLAADERGEVYHRYAQQPRNLLGYRQLRFWALARDGRWGGGAAEQLMVKLGTDGGNAYIYRTSLERGATGDARPEDWREVVVDFGEWFDLRARAEELLLEAGADGGTARPLEVWSADSAYAVVLEDRARAPNLAAVREISLAVHNGGAAPVDGEVWIGDMRLTGGVTDPGVATRVGLDLAAGDLASANVSVGRRGARFRQLDENASYVDAGELRVSARVDLGRVMPDDWGVDAPVSVTHERTGDDPVFLGGSDLRAGSLDGLRETGHESTRIGFRLRRRTPLGNRWIGAVADHASLRLGYSSVHRGGITSRGESRGAEAEVAWDRELPDRRVDLLPGFAEAVLRTLLPAVIEESAVFERLRAAELRWTPAVVSLSTAYHTREELAYRFDRILRTAADRGVRPSRSPREGLDHSARLALRPLESLSAELSITSARDLLPTARIAPDAAGRQAIAAERARVAGIDLGWETRRAVGTRLSYRPRVTEWLRPTFDYTARYGTDRHPSYLEGVVTGADTAWALQRDAYGDRRLTRSLMLDPRVLADAGPDSSAARPSRARRGLLAVARALEPVYLDWTSELDSRFARDRIDPGLGYQLGLGGLHGFRFMDGDTAVTALRREGLRLEGGLRFTPGLTLRTVYGVSDGTVYDLRAGRRERTERTWPDARLSWDRLPIPAALDGIVTFASATIGARVERRRSGLTRSDVRRTRQVDAPIRFDLGLANGLGIGYNGTIARGTAQDGTGTSRRRGSRHAVRLRGSVRAPDALRATFPEPIRTVLAYRHETQSDCRVRTGDGAASVCVRYIDNRIRQLDLTLDTLLSDLNVGMQMAYIDRHSYIGTQRGSTDVQLRLFANFNYSVGSFLGAGR